MFFFSFFGTPKIPNLRFGGSKNVYRDTCLFLRKPLKDLAPRMSDVWDVGRVLGFVDFVVKLPAFFFSHQGVSLGGSVFFCFSCRRGSRFLG